MMIMAKEKIQKTSIAGNVKEQTAATVDGLKELGDSAKTTMSEVFDIFTEIKNLPWKDLPLKGWLCLGFVALFGILTIILFGFLI